MRVVDNRVQSFITVTKIDRQTGSKKYSQKKKKREREIERERRGRGTEIERYIERQRHIGRDMRERYIKANRNEIEGHIDRHCKTEM